MNALQERIIKRLRLADTKPFRLSKNFVRRYARRKAPFGFNGLGEIVYLRTYSRIKENGSKEQWHETIERVVNGTYTLQKRWVEERGLPWNDQKAQRSAQEMYDRMFYMKFLPPGRGLWAMGSPITEERGLYAALNNCSFVSTDNLKEDYSKPFAFLMDMSMLGVGVGFDTKGEEQLTIIGPDTERKSESYEIPDTREGWVKSVRILIDSYLKGTPPIKFNYKKIREEGTPIKGFGGISSGPEPLKELHKQIKKVLDKEIDKPISATTIVDLQNLIGKCVVSGNVRRTAEIAFGDPNSEDYLDLKNYTENPHRESYGWTSNNSVFATLGMKYDHVAERTRVNGEPGYAWLENMQTFGRMSEPPNNKDKRAKGGNPCLEQTLESYELCCLVECFPAKHKDKTDFLRTLKFAYLYAKTVTLGETHWTETNRVLLRNRRIGCSVSGIAQFLNQHGVGELHDWLIEGYETIQRWDEIYSEWLIIRQSIKTTSVKPSGSVSLLAGATPGIHYPISEYYIRRVRLGKTSELINPLKRAGYKILPAYGNEKATVVVEIPVHAGDNIRKESDVSMWEQLSLAAFMQRFWADNQVSATITFDPKEEGYQIAQALNFFQWQLKGVSFLPRQSKVYRQMPYEPITEGQYKKIVSRLKPVKFTNIRNEQVEVDKFCDGMMCEVSA